MTVADEERLCVSLGEAAKMLGVSERHACTLARAGELPGAYRLRGRWLVHLEAFKEGIERMARSGPVPAANPLAGAISPAPDGDGTTLP